MTDEDKKMDKEELEKEAEESFEQYKVTDEDYVVSPYSDDMGEKMLMYNDEYYAEETYLRLYTQGYLAGAEPREKQLQEKDKKIAELEEGLLEADNATDVFNAQEKRIAELEEKCKELQEENARLKIEAYSHKNNVFAELNDETAHSNEKLMLELEDAKEVIRKLAIYVRDNCYTRTLDENLDRQKLLEKAETFFEECEE